MNDTGKKEKHLVFFSVITVCKNSAKTIADTVRSVAEQTGVEVEHIIKDGISSDGTVEIVRRINGRAKIIEKEDAGIYDAMNQGFSCARGDVVVFLNSDDKFAGPHVLKDIQDAFSSDDTDIAYGNISIVNDKGQILRHWVVGKIGPWGMRGKQIPHPSLFVRSAAIQSLDLPFDPSYRISADYKQMLILIEKQGRKLVYVPKTLTIMRSGGESTGSLKAIFLGWSECARAHREVLGESGWPTVASKVFSKLSGVRFASRVKVEKNEQT